MKFSKGLERVLIHTPSQLVAVLKCLVELGFKKDYYLSDDHEWLRCGTVDAPLKDHHVEYLLSGKISGHSFDMYTIEMEKAIDSNGVLIVFNDTCFCSLLTKLLAAPELHAVN
jgi:hypothetical protein